MDWRKLRDWKLLCFIAALFTVFGDAVPHVEPLLPQYGPTTVSAFQISGGGQVANTSPGYYSFANHPWLSQIGQQLSCVIFCSRFHQLL
jgi:hypothetical protein